MTVHNQKPIQCNDTPEYKVGDYVKYGRDCARVIAVLTHPTAPTVYRIMIVDGEKKVLDVGAQELVRDA